MSRIQITAICLAFLFVSQSAWAHYLWVTVDKKTDKPAVANLYFEGGPGAGNGKYLEPFIKHGVMWIRTLENGEPKKLKMEVAEKPKKRWLTAKLEKSSPVAIESYGKWGVYRYGKTDVLLHYNAKNLDVSNAEELSQFARAKHLSLDIVPKLGKDCVEVQVLWKDKPAGGRSVYIRGAGGFKKTVKTDKEGIARFEPKEAGRYTLRTNVEERRVAPTTARNINWCATIVRCWFTFQSRTESSERRHAIELSLAASQSQSEKSPLRVEFSAVLRIPSCKS